MLFWDASGDPEVLEGGGGAWWAVLCPSGAGQAEPAPGRAAQGAAGRQGGSCRNVSLALTVATICNRKPFYQTGVKKETEI